MVRSRLFAGLVASLVATTSFAVVPPEETPLRQHAFRHPDLDFRSVYRPLAELPPDVSARLGAELSRLGADPGNAYFDPLTGRLGTLIVTQPLVPGSGVGNSLEWSDLGIAAPASAGELGEAAAAAFTRYLASHVVELRIDPAELATPRVKVHGERVIQIHVGRVIDGIPVRGAFIGATINSGNLVLLGERKWGEVALDTRPGIAGAAAEASLVAHLEGLVPSGFRKAPQLAILPVSSPGTSFAAPDAGLRHRLVWVLAPEFAGELGTWEASVDAHSGELLAFEDLNHYASRRVEGSIYPVSNDGVPPDGVLQPDFPLPFADIAVDGEPLGFTSTGGNVPPGADTGTISTALSGRYLTMNDTCGAVDESAAIGDLDLEGVDGTDCDVPAGHSPGDTNSTRSGYYELNRIIEQGRGYLPDNGWLNGQLTANMNIIDTCNAFWSGSVNFFRSGGGCSNTGELAGVFDHEWGHGMDNNDATGSVSNPGEGIADIFAANRLNTSCMGRNFRPGDPCNGYGDACLECTGVRDIDWEKRASMQPHDVAWIDANCGGGPAPCGGGVHCEGAVYAEAVWDLVHRDFMGFEGSPWNLDLNTALELGTRLSYFGSSNVGNWFQCTTDGTGGCNADGGYLNYLAVDDDNGDLTDGTPHMTALFAAFDRHQIACPTPTVQDSGCAGAPTTAPANVVATPINEGAHLTWDPVAGASEYWVYRTEGVHGCDFGKTLVGKTTDTEFVEFGLRNGFEVLYGVVAVGDSDACTGPMSACTAVSPVEGPGLGFDPSAPEWTGQTGDGDEFFDNCETGTLTFTVSNTGTGALTNVRIVEATIASHPEAEVLTPLPAIIAASLPEGESAVAELEVSGGGFAFNDTLTLEVTVTSDELDPLAIPHTYGLTALESDLEAQASLTFSFEAGEDGWQLESGIFDRTDAPPGGGNGTLFYRASSVGLNQQCDRIRSPLIELTETSTLELYNQFDIEDFSGGFWWDRANVGVFDPLTGERTIVSPDGGRTYNASGTNPAPAPCASHEPPEAEGWAGPGPDWLASTWTPAALGSPDLAGQLIQLDVAYGTDPAALGTIGFWFDEVTLTDVSVQVPDAQGDECGEGGPVLSFDPASLDFGDVEVGTTSPPQATTLSNTGDVDATGVTFSGLPDAGFEVASSDCGDTLPAGGSCAVSVTFTPAAPGSATATLHVDSTEGATADLALAGNGIGGGGPIADIVCDSLDFELPQGSSGSSTCNIGNIGDADLTWSIEEAEGDALTSGVPYAYGLAQTPAFHAPVGYDRASGNRTKSAPADRVVLPAPQPGVIDELSEAFDDITQLPGAGWALINNSEPTGPTSWFQGNETIFPAHEGEPDAYIAANFESTDDLGTISNWLITPEVTIANGTQITFWTRKAELFEQFADRMEVRMSVAGDSTDVGDTAESVGAFTEVLLTINPDLIPGEYPQEWTQFVVTVSEIPEPTSGRFAFRYWVTDSGPDGTNGDYIGIDTVSIAQTGGGACDSPVDIPWLAADPTGGTTPPAGSVPVDVNVDTTGLDEGDYTALLCVSTNDPEAPLVELPVSLTVIPPTGGPIADITPESFSFEVPQGGSDSDTLNVGNIGGADLVWSLDEAEGGLMPLALPEGAPYRYGLAETPAFNAPVGYDRASGITRGRGEAPATPIVLPAPQPAALGEFSEGFDDITQLPGAGWALINNSEPLGPSSWFQGNETIFPAHEGEPDAYIAANFESVDDVGTISNWLITPEVTIVNGTTITFWTRKAELFGEFADRMEVRMSVAGASTDVGDTAESVGDFTEVLLTINPDLIPGEYPQEWTQFVLTVRERSREPVTGRFAFRYWVTDAGPDGTNADYIGIDTVGVKQPGEPPPGGCDTPVDVPWLAADPTSGTTPPAGSVPVAVSVDTTGLEVGDYKAQLCVTTNDPNAPLVPVPVDLTVTEAGDDPLIDVDPESLSSTLTEGDSETQPLTIANVGGGTLDWQVTEEGVTGLWRPRSVRRSAAAGPGGPPSEEVLAGEALRRAALGGTRAPASLPVRAQAPTAAEEAAGIDRAPAVVRAGGPRITGRARSQLLQEGMLLVPNTGSDAIVALDPATGDVLDPAFISIANIDGGAKPHAVIHPDGERLLITAQTQDVVHAYDLATGDYLGVFAPAGGADPSIMDNIRGMAFHPATGNLLVTSDGGTNADSVVEFDLDGNFLGVFIDNGAGGISSPWSMVFRDSDLLLSNGIGDGIYSFAQDGTFLELWEDDTGNLSSFPQQITGIGNGNVLAAAFSSPSGAWEFDSAGALIDVYDPETGLRGVFELANGNLLVTNGGGVHEITRDNTLVETKITGSSYMITPVQASDCALPTWVSVDPTSGSLPGGESQVVDVTFDATGLEPGDYTANLCLASNDPVTPLVTIPLTLTVEGGGGGLDVLLAAAFGGPCNSSDPQTKILATGLFASVDTLDLVGATPTVAELLEYDAVMVWTNLTPQDTPQLSDNLADYVDAGGGVVVTVFANSSTTSGRSLTGRWVDDGYEVIVGQSGNRTGLATLGTVHQPDHPLMDGVSTFDGGTSSFRPDAGELTAGSASIADWSDPDGIPLIAVHGTLPNRADLGFYPPSSDCSATWWDSATDGARIMANALVYVAGGGDVRAPKSMELASKGAMGRPR